MLSGERNLQVRIASAAEHAGNSMHSFILEAIEEKLDLVERRAGFEAEADARHAKLIQSRKTIPWVEMRQYLEGRVGGKLAEQPVSRKRT